MSEQASMAGALAAQRFAGSRGHGQRRSRWASMRWLFALFLLLPAVLLASHRVLGWGGVGEHYSVSVPVTLKIQDPELWSLVNAQSFDAARSIDPELPDPALVPTLTTGAPPADPATLRQEAYVGPAARRYIFRGATATDTARAHYCLTAALYYEAASETDDGMRGVAQVVLNRVRHPSFPASICSVVFQGSQRAGVCQFTFACDGSMARAPSRAVWSRASRIAAEALAGRVFAPVGLATHYHTLAVWPSWGRTLAMTNVVGAHIFHRWRGRYGELAAFSRPYSGRESPPGPYLPIAQQLAALGRGGPSPAEQPGTGGAVDAEVLAAINRAQAVGLEPAVPVRQTAPAIAGQTAAGTDSAAQRAGRPAPAYIDPRLAGSGSVREEYRSSGSAISR